VIGSPYRRTILIVPNPPPLAKFSQLIVPAACS
jgi:hypothetical protein